MVPWICPTPCFDGADLTALDTLVPNVPGGGPMSMHGTHVASLLFGQPGGPVFGLAPRCRGLIAPVFRDGERLSQLDLSRAIEQAVGAGANIINISGGEPSPTGEADGMLAHALQICADNGVLVVAAVGNDGCDCLQVPAAVSPTLAVGAAGLDGQPLEIEQLGRGLPLERCPCPGSRPPGGRTGRRHRPAHGQQLRDTGGVGCRGSARERPTTRQRLRRPTGCRRGDPRDRDSMSTGWRPGMSPLPRGTTRCPASTRPCHGRDNGCG